MTEYAFDKKLLDLVVLIAIYVLTSAIDIFVLPTLRFITRTAIFASRVVICMVAMVYVLRASGVDIGGILGVTTHPPPPPSSSSSVTHEYFASEGGGAGAAGSFNENDIGADQQDGRDHTDRYPYSRPSQ